jgi:Sulfotransferase family
MLCRMLEGLGLFVGQHIDENHEAVYFSRINQAIFARVNAAWDHPQGVREFLKCDDAVELTAGALAADLESHRIAQFLGWRKWLTCRSIQHFDFPWGWKDPRTIFTLPLWLRLFPQARIVYIVRHGLHVAHSLMVREQQMLSRRQAKFVAQMAQLRQRSHLLRAGYKGSARCLTITGGFALWEEYLAAAEQTLGEVSNPRILFRYEDLLADPRRHLSELVEFCELGQRSSEEIAHVAENADCSRSRQFPADPALSSFFERVTGNPWLARFGYC